MATDQSGLRWPSWPTAGAVGAGRRDEVPEAPTGFGLTPSAAAEQEAQAAFIAAVEAHYAEHPRQEVSGEGPERTG